VTGLLRTKRRPAVGDPIHVPTIKTSATAEARSKKGHLCRPLPTRFRYGGFDYRQICREGHFAIYEQGWNGLPNPYHQLRGNSHPAAQRF
jgi:hypothetical protein